MIENVSVQKVDNFEAWDLRTLTYGKFINCSTQNGKGNAFSINNSNNIEFISVQIK